MIEPIKPTEVKAPVRVFPDKVIEAINELIAENFSVYSGEKFCKIMMQDAAARVAKKMKIKKQLVFDKNYLDIEEVYREAGWQVEFHKLPYYETGDNYFIFRYYIK